MIIAIVVDEDVIEETQSEKLIGIVINEKLTLHGDYENDNYIRDHVRT